MTYIICFIQFSLFTVCFDKILWILLDNLFQSTHFYIEYVKFQYYIILYIYIYYFELSDCLISKITKIISKIRISWLILNNCRTYQ